MNIVQQLTQELRNCTKDFTKLEAELRETKAILESTKRSEEMLLEQLRQAYVVIQALNEQLALKS